MMTAVAAAGTGAVSGERSAVGGWGPVEKTFARRFAFLWKNL